MEDKRGEEYVAPPPPAYVAFSGGGATLGGGAIAEAAAAMAGAAAGGGAAGMAAGMAATFALDAAAPTTVVALRLLDGSRVRATLNLSHTVAELRAHIATLPGGGGGLAPYMLLAGFPPKPLLDDAATVEAAGLKGAQITQKSA
jgi:UBX domain-containing protein 1